MLRRNDFACKRLEVFIVFHLPVMFPAAGVSGRLLGFEFFPDEEGRLPEFDGRVKKRCRMAGGFRLYDMPLFRGSEPEVVDPILKKSPGRYSSYGKGDFIAMQNSVCRSLYLLCEGSVYAQMTNDEGKVFVLDALDAPDVLASTFIFGTEGLLPVSIIAHTDCKLWIVDKMCVLELLEKDHAVLRNFLTVLSDHSLFLSGKLNDFALQTLSSRVIGYLSKNGSVQNLQETAFILGVARPSLSRAIAQLIEQGVVRKSGSGYVLNRCRGVK